MNQSVSCPHSRAGADGPARPSGASPACLCGCGLGTLIWQPPSPSGAQVTSDNAEVGVSLPTAPPSFAPQELGITSQGAASLVSDISSEPPHPQLLTTLETPRKPEGPSQLRSSSREARSQGCFRSSGSSPTGPAVLLDAVRVLGCPSEKKERGGERRPAEARGAPQLH